MKGSGAEPTKKAEDPPPKDLPQENESQTQKSEEENDTQTDQPQESKASENSDVSTATQNNSDNSPSPANDELVFWSALVNDEVMETLLAAEDAIERNLKRADQDTEKLKTQKYLLNLCYYVTHNRSLDIAALNWLVEYANSSIGMTLDEIYKKYSIEMPLPLVTYLLQQPPNTEEQREEEEVPPRYSPISDTSTESSPTTEVPVPHYIPISEDSSRAESPVLPDLCTPEPPPLILRAIRPNGGEKNLIQLQPLVINNYNHLLPLTVLPRVRMIRAAKRALAQAQRQEEEKLKSQEENAENLPKQEAQEINPKILLEVPNSTDWKYLQCWVKFLEDDAIFDDDALVWLIICIVNTQQKVIFGDDN